MTCHPRGENYGHRTTPSPCVPHGGTPEAPNRRRRVVGPGAPQYPLTPSGWHALRAGAWHRCRRVVVVAVSCRRVVAPVAPVPNCPSQDSTCARLQCSCKSQSLEQPAGERDWRVEEVLQERPCFCGGRGHPLPQGGPRVVGGGDAWLESVIQRT